jgi:hypothetical protein
VDNDNPYKKKINEIAPFHLDELAKMYRGYGGYYNSIVRSLSDKIFNWAYTLNGGGIALTITFMGAAIKWDSLSKGDFYSFLLPISFFAFGIISVIFASFFEHHRFVKKGALLFGCSKLWC